MEAVLHGSFQSAAYPAIQNRLVTTSFPSSSSSSDWVPVKNHPFLSYSHVLLSKRSSHPRNCVVKVAKEQGAYSLQVEDDQEKSKPTKKNLAVFVSGGGSNFKSIYEATVTGQVLGDVVVLVTNKPDCGGAEFARDKNIPVIVFPKRKGAQEVFSGGDLVAALRSYKVDFIFLAGYLKLIPTELIQAYPKSIWNIHPSLLPAFGGKGYYGMKVHKAVIASGARYSGPTIHYVDEEYDTGRILAQRVVPVLANDTAEELAARVLHQEHKLYVEVASALCEDRIIWRDDGVPYIQSKENPDKYT